MSGGNSEKFLQWGWLLICHRCRFLGEVGREGQERLHHGLDPFLFFYLLGQMLPVEIRCALIIPPPITSLRCAEVFW